MNALVYFEGFKNEKTHFFNELVRQKSPVPMGIIDINDKHRKKGTSFLKLSHTFHSGKKVVAPAVLQQHISHILVTELLYTGLSG